VPCSAALAGDGGTGEASAALVSDEEDGPTGEARQPIGPISIWACAIASIGTGLFTYYALCPQGRTERARRRCDKTGLWGSAGITLLCAIPF
jgi:hypothetical protein